MRLFRKVSPADSPCSPRPLWRRIARRAVHVKLALLGLVLLVGAAAILRLVAGPVSLRSYSDRVAQALAEQIGPGWTVKLVDT